MRIDFERTLRDAERDEQDLDYVARHHSYFKYQEKFGYGFQVWYQFMESSLNLREGGYPFNRDDFEEYEWQAMGMISSYKRISQWQSTQARPK